MQIKTRIIELLEKAGLTRAEAVVYLTASEKQGLPLVDLSKETQVSRATVYRAIDRLRMLGLLKTSPDNWKQRIETVSLRHLARLLSREQLRLRKIELELQRLEPLRQIEQRGLISDPVSIISRPEDISRKAYELVEGDWDIFLCYGSAERLPDVIGKIGEDDFRIRRVKQGKKVVSVLTEVGPYAASFIPNNKTEYRQVRYQIDPSRTDYCVYVLKNEVVIWEKDLNLGKRVVVLSDPAVTKSYTALFRSTWSKADRNMVSARSRKS